MSDTTDTVHYKQAFWVIEGLPADVGPEVRAQVAKAALTLQYEVPGTILFATSAGGYDASEKPEISLVLPPDVDVRQFDEPVKQALLAEGVPGDVKLEEQAWFYELTKEDVKRVQKSTRIDDLNLAKRSVDQLVNLPKVSVPSPGLPHVSPFAEDLARLLLKDGGGLPTGTTLSSAGLAPGDIPPEDRLEGFSVDSETFKRLKNARDGDITKEYERIRKSMGDLANATKTNVAVGIMVIGGIITVGKAMWSLYVAVGAAGSITAMISGLIAAVGGILPFIGIVAAVAAIIIIAWILLKDAVNELMVVHELTTGVKMAIPEDYIMHGERYGVTVDLPAAPDPNTIEKPMAYPGGFYAYRKARLGGQAVGFYGSTLGMAFDIENTAKPFSIGLDCPVSIFGGTNCIYVMQGANAKKAAEEANRTGNATMTITMDNVVCTGSRAAKLGSVNYAICTLSGSAN